MKKSTPVLILSIAAATATFFSCQKNPTSAITDPGREVLEMPAEPYAYFDGSGNTVEDKKAALGRVLFYDKHLSINNSVSCASCHKQAFAFADNVAFSRGFENRLTSRNSMPLENLPGQFSFGGGGTVSLFWDGRSGSLEDLITRPIGNHVEMGISDLSTLPGKLSELSYYTALFRNAYGDESVTLDRISESMSLFLSAIRADNSKFDQMQMNTGQNTLSAKEQYGMVLFDSKYNCRNCHQLTGSVYMTGFGNDFINIGLDPVATDKGRSAITGSAADNGKFRVPNLHNVAITAPYMHDGRFKTLEEVIDHYSHGINSVDNLDDRLKGEDGKAIKMNISADEKAALIAFLGTLTDNSMTTDPRFSNPFKNR